MRLLFVTGRLHPWNSGGVGVFQRKLIENLSYAKNLDLTLIGAAPWNLGKTIPMIPSKYSTKTKVIRTIGNNDSFLDILLSNLKYPPAILGDRFDVAHFNILPGFRVATTSRLLAVKSSIRVANIHGVPEEVEAYVTPNFSARLARLHWNLALSQLASFDALVVNSTFSLRILQRYLPSGKYHVIPNGVDERLFGLVVSEPNVPTILCFGAITPLKGQNLLLDALSTSSLRNKCRLLLIGRILDPDYYALLRRKVVEASMESVVRILPHMNELDLWRMIASSTICVFPSLMEGFGMSVMEAMAAGKPVIATKYGGPMDYIDNGEDGFLVNPHDLDILARTIERLVADPNLRYQVGQRAKKKARKYTWREVTRRYIELYTSLLR